MPRVAVIFTGGHDQHGLRSGRGRQRPDPRWRRDPRPDARPRRASPRSSRSIAGGSRRATSTFADLIAIWGDLRRALADPTIDGVVVVQGTDTIEETTFAWDLLHAGPQPVVVTGAMRAPHEAGFDGPANLRDAVAIAASPEARDLGVVVSLAGTIEAADDVQKTHTTAFTTFASPNGGSLGGSTMAGSS